MVAQSSRSSDDTFLGHWITSPGIMVPRAGTPARWVDQSRSLTVKGGQQMTGQTGHKCPRSGLWQGSDRHREQIALSLGETFPPCGDCRGDVTWTLIRP